MRSKRSRRRAQENQPEQQDKMASQDMTVVVNTADGTATLAGLDYTALTSVLATISAPTSACFC